MLEGGGCKRAAAMSPNENQNVWRKDNDLARCDVALRTILTIAEIAALQDIARSRGFTVPDLILQKIYDLEAEGKLMVGN